jgi:RNA polymerase sigma factor (sigma-70 family)
MIIIMNDLLSSTTDLSKINTSELISRCSGNKDDSSLWTEFLRRFSPMIKTYIQSTLRQYANQKMGDGAAPKYLDANQKADLFQSTIMRLIQNDCAALRRFSGVKESDILVYLAVVARSVVRDFMRRQSALRRLRKFTFSSANREDQSEIYGYRYKPAQEELMERGVLAHEIEQMFLNAINNNSAEPVRDRLIYQLHYVDGLSSAQIAACQGVNLSKTGVEKMLNRLESRVRSVADTHSNKAQKL